MGVRRENTLPFPKIEYFKTLNAETLVESHFRTVKYGEYEYRECLDGFVQVYCHGHLRPEHVEHNGCASYVLVYGEDQPPNMCGPVERRQTEKHAILYSVLQALKNIPTNSYKKVCICVCESGVIDFICRAIPELSENSYRSVRTGRLIQDLETSMEINEILRARQDITVRMKFIPTGIGYHHASFARNWAMRVSRNLTQQKKRNESQIPNYLEMDLSRDS